MKKTASNDNLVTKMEIVRDLAKKSKLTHSVAKDILNNLLDIIERNLKNLASRRATMTRCPKIDPKSWPVRRNLYPASSPSCRVPPRNAQEDQSGRTDEEDRSPPLLLEPFPGRWPFHGTDAGNAEEAVLHHHR